MAQCLRAFLRFSVILIAFCNFYHVTASPSDCSAMFTTGILTADSSTLQSTSHSTDLEPYKAIVNTSKAWCANAANTFQYLQINLGKVRNITSIDVQGYDPGYTTYVKTFTITYKDEVHGWQYVKDQSNNIKVFSNGATDENDVINHPVSLSTSSLRIKPHTWEAWICLKIELYTSDPVNGSFSAWSSWGNCMPNGTQVKTRSCNSPPPARGGLDCEGVLIETQTCTPNVTDSCVVNPCQYDSQCISSGANYTCNCADGFIGRNCSHIDPCVPSPCRNGSTCLSFVNGSTIDYSCNCTVGFEGRNCTGYQEIIWDFRTDRRQHDINEVVIPVAASASATVVVSGSFGFVYWLVRRRLLNKVYVKGLRYVLPNIAG